MRKSDQNMLKQSLRYKLKQYWTLETLHSSFFLKLAILQQAQNLRSGDATSELFGAASCMLSHGPRPDTDAALTSSKGDETDDELGSSKENGNDDEAWKRVLVTRE